MKDDAARSTNRSGVKSVRWTRRQVIGAGLSLSAGVALRSFACRRRVLYVANWADLIAPETIPSFEHEHGCRVVYENYSANEDLAAKLRGSTESYDVVFPSDYMVERLRLEGRLLKLDHTLLPNLSHIGQRFLDQEYDPGNAFSVPYTYWGTGLAVNTARFSDPAVGRDWLDLERPEARGRITLLDEMRYTLGLGLIMRGLPVNTRKKTEVDAAADTIVALKPHVMAFVTDVIDLLVAGDPALAYAYSGDVYQAASNNEAIHFAIPAGGGIVGIDNACITSGCRDRGLAHAFLDFLMRPEVGSAFTQHTFYATPNKTAVDRGFIPRELVQNPAIFIPLGSTMNVLRDLGEATELYASAWERVKAA